MVTMTMMMMMMILMMIMMMKMLTTVFMSFVMLMVPLSNALLKDACPLLASFVADGSRCVV